MSYWTTDKLDVACLLQHVSDPRLGGTALFLGTVRAGAEDGQVVQIEYTAYESMLDREFDRIVTEAKRQWTDAVVQGSHRLGVVPAGEASIAVVAAAPHRAEAFAACRYVIEEVKKRLPVWKKEILEDGSETWRPNRVESVGSKIVKEPMAPPPSNSS